LPQTLQRDIFDPGIGHDHIGGWIPVAVHVQTCVKTVAVIISLDLLRELNFAVDGKADVLRPTTSACGSGLVTSSRTALLPKIWLSVFTAMEP